MKKLIFLLPILAALASCNNKGNMAPVLPDSATVQHTVKLLVTPQQTKVSIKDSTLTLAFNEDVTMLLNAQGYDHTYAVHLTQDFTSSALNKLDYTTVNNGATFYDYLEDNLNNVSQKTVSDTSINGVTLKKIHLVRLINFVQKFANAQLASNAQTAILSTHTDMVAFSSYVFYDKSYPATTAAAAINYTSN